MKLRSRGGSNELVNLLHVCNPCHVAITDNRPGTDRFRTFSWQKEGERESDSPTWKQSDDDIGGTNA